MGACIQCSNKNCFVAFHVTCARRCQLSLKMKNSHGGMADKHTLKGFCDKHVPLEWRDEHDVDAATEAAKEYYRSHMKGKRWEDSQQAALAQPGPHGNATGEQTEDGDGEDFMGLGGNKRKKTALQKKIWRLPSGAPIVPQAVFNNVENLLNRWQVRKRKEFVAEACKYWTLKREARRGAALLKRLQLQLDTFTSMEMTRRDFAAMGAAGGLKLNQRIEFAKRMEGDINQISVMCEAVVERELLKLKDAEIMRDLVDTVYFPMAPLMLAMFDRVVQ